MNRPAPGTSHDATGTVFSMWEREAAWSWRVLAIFGYFPTLRRRCPSQGGSREPQRDEPFCRTARFQFTPCFCMWTLVRSARNRS